MEIDEDTLDFLFRIWPLAFPLILFWALVRKDKYFERKNSDADC